MSEYKPLSYDENKDWSTTEVKDPCGRCGRDINEINDFGITTIDFPKKGNLAICDDCKEDLKKFLDLNPEPRRQ